MFLVPKIHINDVIPDGILVGYDMFGSIICCIEFHPNYEFLFGDEDEHDSVVEWSVCNTHARRIAMIVAWKDNNYVCAGTT